MPLYTCRSPDEPHVLQSARHCDGPRSSPFVIWFLYIFIIGSIFNFFVLINVLGNLGGVSGLASHAGPPELSIVVVKYLYVFVSGSIKRLAFVRNVLDLSFYLPN